MTFALAALDLEHFKREQWLGKKLGLADFNTGVTTSEERRERIRAAIIDSGLAEAECFTKDGRAQSYAEAFRNTYGSPLVTDELELSVSTGGR